MRFLKWLGLAVAGAIAIAGAILWYSLWVPGKQHRGPLPQLTAEEADLAARLRTHVTAIASRPHNIAHFEALEAAAVYIERTLVKFGYQVALQVFKVDGRLVRNIEVAIEPVKATPETPAIVIGAHYDSAGTAPGANDNGSGTAAVIELARLLRDSKPAATRLRLVFFVNEEPPYFQTPGMGSVRYAELLGQRNERVTAMLSLESIGFFSDSEGSQHYHTYPLISG